MSLFCKRQSYLPSVVLPRPAWQEKAHCVAAGSFFYFHIYHFLCLLFICRFLLSYLLHFISIILMQAPSIDISVLTSMASFPSVDHFMFVKFRSILFFRDTFSSLSKELTCFKESTRMSKQTSVGQVSSTTGTLTHWGWTILSYEDLF